MSMMCYTYKAFQLVDRDVPEAIPRSSRAAKGCGGAGHAACATPRVCLRFPGSLADVREGKRARVFVTFVTVSKWCSNVQRVPLSGGNCFAG